MDDEPDFGMGDDEGAPGEGDLGPPGPPPHREENSEPDRDEPYNEMSRPGEGFDRRENNDEADFDDDMGERDGDGDDQDQREERGGGPGGRGGQRPLTGFPSSWSSEFGGGHGGPGGPPWRGGNRGFRGGPGGPPRFMRGGPMGPGGGGQFGGPRMRGRGGFGGPPMGHNGYGPPMRGGRGGFGGPRGPPHHGGWGEPSFHGPPRGMGGPRGMMHGGRGGPWGGGPPHHGGWEDEEGYEMGRPDMMHGHHGGDISDTSNPLGIDLSGEVWVETKTEEGKSYFYNARTRETTWSRPEEAPGVRILSQTQVEQLTAQLAGNEGGGEPKGPEDAPPFGMPPPGAFMGGPPGFMPPGGGPPGGAPFGMPPPGFPPPWGMPPPGAIPPPWVAGGPVPFVEPCDWSEHTSPDGKKYYYNAKSGESVWEKPKEFADYEKRMKASAAGMPPNPVPAVSAPAKLTDAANSSIAANGEDKAELAQKSEEISKVATADTTKHPTAAATTATTAAVAATTTAASTMSAADKSKPVSSSPVSGTPWCVVWTGDNRVFFYNPTTKTSVWERPPELVGRSDVSEMMKSVASAEKLKARLAAGGKAADAESESESDDDERANAGKKNKGKGAQQKTKKPEPQLIFQDELNKQKAAANGDSGDLLKKGSIDLGKEAAMEAEVRAAKERQLVPLETRMTQFRDLLTEKEISAFSTWEKELHKIVFDPRYLLLTSKERKQVFDKYVRERAEEERREKKNRMREKRDQFLKFLEECNLSVKTTFSEFSNKYGKEERFKAVEKSRERESLFNEHLLDLRRREKEERMAKRDQIRKDFLELLKESSDFVDRHSVWTDVKKKLENDPRFKAVESGREREDYFLDFVHDLKDEYRREKDKKKNRRSSRSRSRSRSKGRSRRSRSRDRKSRSRSRDRDSSKKKSEKKSKKRSRSRDDEDGTTSRSGKGSRKSRDDYDSSPGHGEKKRKRDEKEEGEMSDEEEDYDHKKRKNRRQSGAGGDESDVDVDKKKKRKKEKKSDDESDDADANGDRKDDDKKSASDRDVADEEMKDGDDDDEKDAAEAEERAKREKEERVAASLRKREAEVAKELSGHLHARDKEREQHRHAEAVSNFQALLTDLIRSPDFTWKEARKILKKDARYDFVSDNLEKSERERLFDEHIDALIAKKKDNFRRMLDECKAITLDSTFKEIKKLIKDDPRYSKYSSSDRKCEKQFNEYMKDRMGQARTAFKQLLIETKKITDKSLSLVKEKDSGHLTEIEEVLSKDRRYLDLDGFKEERTHILMDFLEEVERRGPPPPPTASEPNRRSAKL